MTKDSQGKITSDRFTWTAPERWVEQKGRVWVEVDEIEEGEPEGDKTLCVGPKDGQYAIRIKLYDDARRELIEALGGTA